MLLEDRPVLILGAMDGEIKAFLDHFQILGKQKWNGFIFYPGKLENKNIVIAKTGVGKVLSAMVTQKLIDLFNPSAIICTGVAGSLNKKFKLGDIIVAADSVQHDFDATHFNLKRGEIPYTSYRFFKSDENLFQIALSYRSSKNKVYPGRVLTGDQFITDSDSDERIKLNNELQGDCVEMEGASVALVSTVNNLPHLIIRTISDNADGENKLNFREFLKIASENSLNIVTYLLNKIQTI